MARSGAATIDDLVEHLRRLAPIARLAHFEPKKRVSLSEMLGGETVRTPKGPLHIVERFYDSGHRHGNADLNCARHVTANELVEILGDPEFEDFDLSSAAFLDTETTGLMGGTGVLAFLVGVGYFVSSGFKLTQFLVTELDSEESMLEELRRLLAPATSVVTYNGKAYDIPLLEMRYILNHARWPLVESLHADLLFPARRFWRERLVSVALPNIERHILGHRREEDVPGYLIPQIYAWYLRTKDPRPLRGVLAHNAQDILALAALVGALAGHLRKWNEVTDPADGLSLAKHLHRCGREEDAIQLFCRICDQADDMPRHQRAFSLLTKHLKRRRDYEAASGLWRKEHETYGPSGEACVELAKFYEHKVRDVGEALRWAKMAAECQFDGSGDLPRRLARLQAKVARAVARS